MNLMKLRLILLILVVIMAGCQKPPSSTDNQALKKLSIVTTLFPLYDFARTICGDKANVTLLLPPGVEAHSFEPKPTDLLAISKADIFVYTNPTMEPWATKVLKSVANPSLIVIDASLGTDTLLPEHDLSEEHGHGDEKHHQEGPIDPHIWLDLQNTQKIIDTLGSAIAAKDSANASFYNNNATAYKAELAKLDDEFKSGLKSCRTRTFIHGGHYAFGYLAHRYGLTYRSAQAINPDAEPTPGTISELIKLLKSNHLKYVYAEELVSPKVSEMLSREAGVNILTLHGAHNISKNDLASGVTFIGLMGKNLANLRTGLECK